MSVDETSAADPVTRPVLTLSVKTLAWAVAGLLFVLLRLAPVWQAPVNGAEIAHLSGAWQAHLGAADDRFVPTLFQALAALSLHLTSSPVLARAVAFAAAATIPGALYLLRSRLGEAGALVALLLLAVDAPALALGSQASAMGFDLPLTLWLFVLMTRGTRARWLAPVAALLVATGGPLALPLLFGWAAARLWERDYPTSRTAAPTAVAVVAGIVVTSLHFGLNSDGPIVAPFQLFATGYDQAWFSGTLMDAAVLYSWPLLLWAAVAAGVRIARRPRPRLDRYDRVLAGWTVAAAAWAISSSQSHTVVPLVALSMPLALWLGPVGANAISAMVKADWQHARFLVPAAGFTVVLGGAIASGWAHTGHATAAETAFLALLAGLSLLALAPLAIRRSARPALIAPVLAVAVPLLALAAGVALSATDEPILSPRVAPDARSLRDIALQAAGDRQGLIVVHPQFRADITWPFRDSGNLVVSSRVPGDAIVVLWPRELIRPEGFVALEGNWALTREVVPPSPGAADYLPYLRWLIDRHSVTIKPSKLAVYIRATE